MNDDRNIDELFRAYRDACPDVEPGANFMPHLWRRIEARHTFGSVFLSLARTAMAAGAALCLLLVVLNFASPSQNRPQTANYTDVVMNEHSVENTDYAEAIHAK